MYLVLLCCVVVAAIFSPSHVECSAVNRIESYLEENNAIVESRSVALPSGVINCGEFQIQNSSGSNTLGSDWFSKTTSRNNVDANQICMDQGYDGQILHYGGNWGVQCGRKLGAVASERLESLGDTVAWKCEMKALVTHEGWCRDKDGAFQQLSHGHETILANCEKGYNTNSDCDVFSYETPTPSDFYNCYHYKSGPYTAGSGRPDTKCYIVERTQVTTASENTGIETTAEPTTTTVEQLTNDSTNTEIETTAEPTNNTGLTCAKETWSSAPGRHEFKACRQSLIDCERCVAAADAQYTWLSWYHNDQNGLGHCWGMPQEPTERQPSTYITLCHLGLAGIDTLPNEVLLMIFKELSFRDLNRVCEVGKHGLREAATWTQFTSLIIVGKGKHVLVPENQIEGCKNKNVKKVGFVVGKVDASTFIKDWKNDERYPKHNEEGEQVFKFVASLQWMTPPLLSWVNAYHGECYPFFTDYQRRSIDKLRISIRGCGVTAAVLKECLTDKYVTADGGLNPVEYKINRFEENWNAEKGYAAWQDKEFSKRARDACETIISMHCTLGYYIIHTMGTHHAGQFVKKHLNVMEYQAETLKHCEALIEAAKSAGYRIMIVESNWKENPTARETYEVLDTEEAYQQFRKLTPKQFYDTHGHAWFFCKCRKPMRKCNDLKHYKKGAENKED